MKTLRVLGLWIVCAALCLQGAVAATLLHRAALPGPPAHGQVAGAADGARSEVAGRAAVPGHHEAQARGDDETHADGHTASECPCGACALCCIASALPVSPPRWVGPEAAAVRLEPPWRAHAAPALAGPERPPRR